MKALLKRLGITYHKVKGLLWRGDPTKQQEFVKKYYGQRSAAKRGNSKKTRFYFVDACHPVWGLDLVYQMWLPKGANFYVPMGSGRKRMNILGAYCVNDQELVRITTTEKGDNINKFKFIELMEKIKEKHPETERFVLYLDNAGYFKNPEVRAWLEKNPQFCLEYLPTYSPNLNLIERLWGFLKDKAFKQFHKTFESMCKAANDVLDNLDRYRKELDTLMTEKFHIIDISVYSKFKPAA